MVVVKPLDVDNGGGGGCPKQRRQTCVWRHGCEGLRPPLSRRDKV